MLMKLNVILKILSIEMILALELTKNQNVMNGVRLEFLSRILTCKLTVRRHIT